MSEDLLDRCTLAVQDLAGKTLATGVLVGPSYVLTCCHVVGELTEVQVAPGPSQEPLSAATVVQCGNPREAVDLALLELKTPLPDRGVIRFGGWERGDRFGTVGFPDWGKDHVDGWIQGISQYHGWLQVDASSSRKIIPGFSGGAVWVPAKQRAVGLVTHRDADGVAYVVTHEQIERFCPRLFTPLDKRRQERASRYVPRIGQKLQQKDIQAVVGDAALTWRLAASHGPEALARVLCLETEPDMLAGALCAAYCRLAEQRQAETAEEVFRLLMEALPAAFLSRWQIALPESSATQIRLELLSRVLAEFALAAADEAPAEFHARPDRSDSDVPRATHHVPWPGELGVDLAGEESAKELAEEIKLRLALDVGTTAASQEEAASFIGVLAAHRHTGVGPRLLDRSDLEGLARSRKVPEGSWREPILKVLNKRLARGTATGRHLYVLADGRDQPLLENLGQSLPELRIVTLEADREQFEETEELLAALKSAFYSRRQPARPTP